MSNGAVPSSRQAHPDKPCAGSVPSPSTIREQFDSLSACRVLVVAGHLSMRCFPVIGCSRFLTETSRRTMDGETGTEGTAAPVWTGAETCGGVMVRGPNSGDGMRSSVYYLASPDLSPTDVGRTDLDARWRRPRARALDEIDPMAYRGMAADSPSPDRRAEGGWRGAGGRWLLWPLRVVLWAALLVVAFRGVTAIVFSQHSTTPSAGAGTEPAAGSQFPVAMGEAYAAEFGRVYLNASPQTQAQREQQLAAFVPASLAAAHPDLGWNGAGQLSLQSEEVAGIGVRDPGHAVVTLLASVNGQLMELGVPIAASGGAVVVSGEPAWLPAPAQASLPQTAVRGSDPVARSQLNNELPAFFQAYANGDSAALNRFLARGVSLTGLGGTVTFDAIAGLYVPPGGSGRQITVSVIWQLVSLGAPTETKLQVTYSMSVIQQSGVKWYVNEISASTEAVGAQ
jgi:hypothetical protein